MSTTLQPGVQAVTVVDTSVTERGTIDNPVVTRGNAATATDPLLDALREIRMELRLTRLVLMDALGSHVGDAELHEYEES